VVDEGQECEILFLAIQSSLACSVDMVSLLLSPKNNKSRIHNRKTIMLSRGKNIFLLPQISVILP
jgi:hypothetical protein